MKKGDKIIKPGDLQIFRVKLQISFSKKQFIYNQIELEYLVKKLITDYLDQKYYNKYREHLMERGEQK